MKVAYISTPHFADCDIPLVGELQKKSDVFYFLKVSDSTKRLTLIKINSLNKRGGVYPVCRHRFVEDLYCKSPRQA